MMIPFVFVYLNLCRHLRIFTHSILFYIDVWLKTKRDTKNRSRCHFDRPSSRAQSQFETLSVWLCISGYGIVGKSRCRGSTPGETEYFRVEENLS